MPDFMDAVQDRCLQSIEVALAEHSSRRTQGTTHCVADDCAGAITPLRQSMGARLCLDCQSAAEAHARHRRGAR